MKRFIAELLVVIVPVVVVLIGINYFGDAAHVYDKDYEQNIAKLLLQGKYVTNVENCDERALKKFLIEGYKYSHFDYVIFGSSRGMTITNPDDDKNVLNLCVSSATIYDYLALLQICFDNNISFDNVVLCIDPDLLNGDNYENRWRTIESSFYKITSDTSIKKDTMAFKQKCKLYYNYVRYKTDKLLNLFSCSYFQSSLKALTNDLRKPVISLKADNINSTKLPNGSHTYNKKYREPTQAFLEAVANNGLRSSITNYNNLSSENKCLLDLFVTQSKKVSMNLVFLTFPYMDKYYEKLIQIKCVRDQTAYINTFTAQKGIINKGSYDPKDFNFDNNDFYDELHLKQSSAMSVLQDLNIFDY